MSIYVYDRPVSGGAFVGRELLMRSLVRGLEQGRSFALCGGPKTGRTSTLLHLESLLHLQWLRRPQDAKTVPVIVDLALVQAGGVKAAAKLVWERIVASIGHPRVFGNSPPPRFPLPSFARAKEPWSLLRESCVELWRNVSGTSAWCRWALLVDDADLLLGRELEELVEPLVALVRGEEHWAPTCLIAAGGRRLREALIEKGHRLAFLRPLFLGALNDGEAEALVQMGLGEVEPEALQVIKQVSGKHPYVLQRLLAEIMAIGAYASVTQVAAGLHGELEPLFERLWREFDLRRGLTYRGAYAAPEHALMQFLIDYGREVQLRQAERELGIQPLKEYGELLEYLGVAERRLRADVAYSYAGFGAWNEWYAGRILR